MSERCNGCGIWVRTNAPYFSTPCGTYCEDCMGDHAAECGVCAKEFGMVDLFEADEEESNGPDAT